LKKEHSPELVEEKARMIYEDYVSILSPREVEFALIEYQLIPQLIKSVSNLG